MILDGAYFFNMKIQEYTNFLTPSDVISFLMKENCGAAGTIFEMVFQTQNEKIADLIIENNEVIFEFGDTEDNAETYKAYISEHPVKKTNADDSYIILSFTATLINTQFYTERLSSTVFGTSLDVIKEMAKMYLETDIISNIEKPAEVERYWLRSYETGAVTMMEAWLHMNLENNATPLLWIDSNNKVHISDIDTIKANGVKHRFIPAEYNPKDKGESDIRYINSFSTTSYKFDTNLITGKNTIVNISTIENGNEIVHIPEDKPDIASTSSVEKGSIGNKVIDNKYQTDNVHNKFMVCYYTNKLRLIQLSSHIGEIHVIGLCKNVNICDFVEVLGCQSAYSGRYLVNTKVTYFGGNNRVKTIIVLCRDNTNSIENSAITPKNMVSITNQQMMDILQSIRTLRRITVMGSNWLDGTTQNQIMGYCKSFKYGVLSSFRVMGAPLNLNSSLDFINSLKGIGNSIINNLIDKYIPYPYNLLLHNLMYDGFSFKRLLSKLFYQFAPAWLRDFLIELIGLLNDLTNLANNLHKQNSKLLSDYNYTSGGYATNNGNYTNSGGGYINSDGDYISTGNNGNNASGSPNDKYENIPKEDDNTMVDNTQQNTDKIEEITDEIIDNVSNIDIPIPPIYLDESDSLLPKEELKEVIAEKVVNYLDGQGYLQGVNNDVFLAILLGRTPLDFNTINLINGNIGNMLYARYWGVYNGEVIRIGTILNIVDNVISIPNTDITDTVFNGDSIIINGTEKSNGTYTVLDATYDDTSKISYIKTLEDVNAYIDSPSISYTYLCDVVKIENVDNYEGQENLSAIYVSGNFVNFLKAGTVINISNLGTDGTCTILKSEFNIETRETIVYTQKVLIDNLNVLKKLNVGVQSENSTTISKLSNDTLTDFYIKQGFKDIYTTVPCTKIINASKGTKVWIALPNIEKDIEFYINSQKVEMDIIDGIDLNLYAAGGAKLWYTLYLSKNTYNSNNVTLEVRRKQ